MFINSSTILFGVVVGYMLNIIIYWLPIKLQKQWLDYSSISQTKLYVCNTCLKSKNTVIFLTSIHLIYSSMFKHKKCKFQYEISLRCPAVEVMTAIATILIVWRFGYSIQTVAALIFVFSLIVLAVIDFETFLLPDVITQPILWLGLIFNLFNLFTDISSAVIGATSGYLSLWVIAYLFKILTGSVGMANGDFKLLAMLGAWLGWQPLLYIVLFASLLAIISIFCLNLLNKHNIKKPIPFGPYLAFMGWLTLLWNDLFNVFHYF